MCGGSTLPRYRLSDEPVLQMFALTLARMERAEAALEAAEEAGNPPDALLRLKEDVRGWINTARRLAADLGMSPVAQARLRADRDGERDGSACARRARFGAVWRRRCVSRPGRRDGGIAEGRHSGRARPGDDAVVRAHRVAAAERRPTAGYDGKRVVCSCRRGGCAHLVALRLVTREREERRGVRVGLVEERATIRSSSASACGRSSVNSWRRWRLGLACTAGLLGGGARRRRRRRLRLWSCLLRPELLERLRRSERGYAVAVATNLRQARLSAQAARSIVERSPLPRSSRRSRRTRSVLERDGPCSFRVFGRSGRGWPIFCLVMDEASHFLSETGGPQVMERVFRRLVPSTAQFGTWPR